MERRANQSQKHIRSIRRTVLLAKKLLSHFKYFISLKKDNIENKENKKETKERLEILNKSNDGFEIADWDLKLRGPGDFFGIRQSGDMDFKIGDIYSDAMTLKQASKAVSYVEEQRDKIEKKDIQMLD